MINRLIELGTGGLKLCAVLLAIYNVAVWIVPPYWYPAMVKIAVVLYVPSLIVAALMTPVYLYQWLGNR